MPHAKTLPDKTCPRCGAVFNRRRFNGRLEDATRYAKRVHCSQSCGNTKDDLSRDGYHHRARQLRGDVCESCGSTEGLHAHHKDRDISNNAPENIATLCGSCHLKLHWSEDRDARLAAARRTYP